MKCSAFALATGLGTLLRVAQPTVPQPVQTLPISNHEWLSGSVTLPNHNTLLFVSSNNSDNVRVLAIGPSGQTSWQTNAKHLQWKGGGAFQFYSFGNAAYACEFGWANDNKLNLRENQLLLQRLDEQGQLDLHTFAQLGAPNKTERTVFGTFAGPEGVFVVAKHANRRAETHEYFLEEYNLRTKQSQARRLDLPKPYVTKEPRSTFHDWVFAGARGGKAYFYRALRGTTPQDNPSNFSVEYEFRMFGSDGSSQGGFTTVMHQKLTPGSYVTFSGDMAHAPSQGHVEVIEGRTSSGVNNHTYSYAWDVYEVSTGGLGDIYLDPASDDIYIAGEYGSRPYSATSYQNTVGTFVYKTKADGSATTAGQNPYPPDVLADKQFLQPTYKDKRRGTLFINPATRELCLEFEQHNRNLLVTYDANLRFVGQLSALAGDRPLHSYWLNGATDAEASNLGRPLMEVPRQYVDAASNEQMRKLKELIDNTRPAESEPADPRVKARMKAAAANSAIWSEELYELLMRRAKYRCVPLADGGMLVVRSVFKPDRKLDIYRL